jgi:tetratricopeptide (TPR) repeat protein
MKKALSFIMVTSILLPLFAGAASNISREIASIQLSTGDRQLKSQLSSALQYAQNGQYENSANIFFALARRDELKIERPQIKYMLGSILLEMKLYQTAAFQFVDVIRLNHPRYSKLAITKLSVVADILGDETILNYAISRVNVEDFPQSNRDMINFRLGEIKLRNKDYQGAKDLFQKIGIESTYYSQALFSKALADLEENQPDKAIISLRRMIEARGNASITDVNKVEAQLALARALYQKQDWEASIEAYSQVPRDTLMWHDAIFEQSWAMLRAARLS